MIVDGPLEMSFKYKTDAKGPLPIIPIIPVIPVMPVIE